MRKYRYKGSMIVIPLPDDCKYSADYEIECTYRFIKNKDKYLINMWLKRKNIHTTFRIDRVVIDQQFIYGERDTICDNLCRVVEQAARTGYFDMYVKQFEMIYKYIGACTDKQEDLHNELD